MIRLGLKSLPLLTNKLARHHSNYIMGALSLPGAARNGAFEADDGSGDLCYLSMPIGERFPQVPQEAEQTGPLFKGTPDEYADTYKKDPALIRRLKNKVRACPQCGKNVAFTLPFCNGCGRGLGDVEISYTNNVFTGFVYGIEKGPFPFTISMRHQSERFIVFDDPLSLTVCHVNVIPTDTYMPDWRYLLTKPREAKELLQEMFERSFGVFLNDFWSDKAWREKHFANADALSESDLRGLVAAGFNSPPSQYQLHMQFMLPPFLPFQYWQYLKGRHFTHGRFFPIEYVLKVLDTQVPYDVNEDTKLDDIIGFYGTKGVDYDAIHKEHYDRYGKAHSRIANWDAADFRAVATETGVTDIESGEMRADKAAVAKVQADDKLTLQAYGRPYRDGKPTGTYYKHAATFPHGLKDW